MRDELNMFFNGFEIKSYKEKSVKKIDVGKLYNNIVRRFEQHEPVKFFHTRKTYDILCSMVRNDADTMVLKSRQCGMTTLSILYAFEHCFMDLDGNNVFWFVYPSNQMTDMFDRKISRWYYGLTKRHVDKSTVYEVGNNKIIFIKDFNEIHPKGKPNSPTHVIFDEFVFSSQSKRNACLGVLADLQTKPKVIEIETTDNELLYSTDGKYPYMDDFNYTDNNQDIDVFFYNWYETEIGIKNGLNFNRCINGTNVSIKLGYDDVCNMLAKPSGVIKTLTNEGWKISSKYVEDFIKLNGAACLKDKPEFDELYKKTVFPSMVKPRPNTMKYGHKDNDGTGNVKSVELKGGVEDTITSEDMIKFLTNFRFWKDVLD